MGFDLLYSRYITALYEPGTMEYILYYVTGILTGRDGKVAEAEGVDPVSVDYADYQDSLRTEGSFTGTAVLEKTDLGIISAVKDPAVLG